MRTSSTSSRLWSRGLVLVLALLVCSAISPAARAAEGAVPVSPGARDGGFAVEARCPTFLWAGAPGARGYELAVFRLSADGPVLNDPEPTLVTRASVVGDARGFTPSAHECLERGQRYAWSVAAAGEELSWSAPLVFEVEAAPSLDELEQAMETFRRYERHGALGPAGALSPSRPGEHGDHGDHGELGELAESDGSPELVRARRPRSGSAAGDALPGALSSPTAGVVRVASAATPVLGAPSLRVSANVALGAASNLFKDDEVSATRWY